MTHVDHLVVSVTDLDAAINRWARVGLHVHRGGKHPGGTFNALMRGPQHAYLELISAEPDANSKMARRVLQSPGPLSWALGVSDLDAVRADAGAHGIVTGAPVDGSRTTPTGQTLRWRLCDLGGQTMHPNLPFLIEWRSPMEPGPADGPVLSRVTLSVPDPTELSGHLHACGLAYTDDIKPQGRNARQLIVMTDGRVEIHLQQGTEAAVTAITASAPGLAAGNVVLDGLHITLT